MTQDNEPGTDCPTLDCRGTLWLERDATDDQSDDYTYLRCDTCGWTNYREDGGAVDPDWEYEKRRDDRRREAERRAREDDGLDFLGL